MDGIDGRWQAFPSFFWLVLLPGEWLEICEKAKMKPSFVNGKEFFALPMPAI